MTTTIGPLAGLAAKLRDLPDRPSSRAASRELGRHHFSLNVDQPLPVPAVIKYEASRSTVREAIRR
jgi:hypothetical protein